MAARLDVTWLLVLVLGSGVRRSGTSQVESDTKVRDSWLTHLSFTYRFQSMLRHTAAVPLIPMMLVVLLCAAPPPRCGTSSPCPKLTREYKVRWSPVIPTWHSCSARQVSTLSLSAPWSPNSLALHPWSQKSVVLHPLLAAPLLREVAAYLISGRPSAAAASAAYICGELFNSSHSPFTSGNI